MILQRESEAAKPQVSAESIAKVESPVKADDKSPETATSPAPVKEASTASPPEAKAEPTETKAEATPAPEEPEDLSKDEVLSKLSPEQQERFEKRLAKEVAKRKEMESEIGRLRTLINATPEQPAAPANAQSKPEPTPDTPLGHISTLEELGREERTVKETKYWAQEQLDREDLGEGIKVGDQLYTRDRLKAIVRNASRAIEQYIPERAGFINAREQMVKRTRETFPWVTDRASPEYATWQQIKTDPALSNRPNADWIAAVQVEGLRTLAARAKVNGQPAPKQTEAKKERAPQSQIGGNASFSPSREATSSQAVKKLQDEMDKMRARKGVSGREVAAYLERLENTRSTR